MAIDVVRLLILASQRPAVARVTITAAEDVADYLNNRKRIELARLEQEGEMTVQIVSAEGVAPEHLVVERRDSDGREVKSPKPPSLKGKGVSHTNHLKMVRMGLLFPPLAPNPRPSPLCSSLSLTGQEFKIADLR